MAIKKYFVDIDGVICKTEGNDYENAIPIIGNIDKVNRLFDSGNIVIYWTARGSSSKKDWYFFTLSQLSKWGCRFNSLMSGKPSYDVIIDDKTVNIDDL